MIYQCFYLDKQLNNCFENRSIYQPFGLEPEVNDKLTLNCPELEDPKIRLHLVDFCAMLHLWRNPPKDNWVGFTSWRQLEKSNVIFNSNDEIEKLLELNDVVAWKKFTFKDTIAMQAESHHPGMTSFIMKMMRDVNFSSIPGSYFELKTGFFADYWLMKKEQFNSYMDWLFPFIEYGIDKINTDPYLVSTPYKGLGFVLERMFNIWYLSNDIKIYDCQRKSTFIDGVYPYHHSPYKVSFGAVDIDSNTKRNVSEALSTKRIAGGDYIEKFEKEFSKKIKSKHAIATCNGTLADAIALKAISIKTGRTNVIVPALTFIAQYNSIIHSGLNPIFVDVDENGLLGNVRKLCEDNNAIVFPVHLLGKTCNLYNYKNIPILEDACEALGSKIGNKYAGTVGLAGTFSLYASHSVSSGEGGVIVTDDDEINHLCKSIRNHGRSGPGVVDVFKFPYLGFNGKMSNLHAAVAFSCAMKMRNFFNAKKKVAKKISHYIGDDFGVVSNKIVPHSFPIKYKSEKSRNEAMHFLDSKGIECRPLFSCIPHEHVGDDGIYPNAQEISSHYLYVPCHHLMSDKDIKYMCNLIKKDIKLI